MCRTKEERRVSWGKDSNCRRPGGGESRVHVRLGVRDGDRRSGQAQSMGPWE